jgi:RND family efflux transporter MFP subunit
MDFLISRIIKTFLTVLVTAAILVGVIFGGIKLVQKFSATETNETKPTNNQQNEPNEETEKPENTSKNPEKVQYFTVKNPGLSTSSTNEPTSITFANNLTKTGLIVAEQEVDLFAELSGKITKIYTPEGSYVKKGQLIAEIGDSTQLKSTVINYNSAIESLRIAENSLYLSSQSGYVDLSTFDNQLRAAKIGLDQTVSQLAAPQQPTTTPTTTPSDDSIVLNQTPLPSELTSNTQSRNTILLAQNQIDLIQKQLRSSELKTNVQLLGLKSQVNQVRSQLELTRLSLDSAKLKAPITGYITALNIDNGSQVGPQAPIATISNLSNILIEASITPEDLLKIQNLPNVSVIVGSREIPGKISYISKTANRISKTLTIRVTPTLDKETILIANTFAKLRFSKNPTELKTPEKAAADNSIKAPISAIRFAESGSQVALINAESKIEFRTVKLSNISNGQANISSGLKSGDKVVIDISKVSEGQTITL